MKAAIEVNLGEDWQILYPEKGLKFEISDFLVEVRLRDDPGICGKQVLHGPHPQVKISQAFANFSRRVARLLENEEGAVQKERSRRLKLAKLHLEQIRSKKMLHVFKGSVMLLGLFSWFWFILAFKDWVLPLGSVVAAVYGDSDGCSSEPCPLVRLRLHDCIHHVGPNEE